MNPKRAYLVLQTALCMLLAAWLAAGAVMILLEGTALQAENPLESIYTAEKVGRQLAAAVPLFFAAIILLAAGIAMKIRDPEAGRPARGTGPMKPAREMKHRGTVQAVLVAAALALIVAGILNGSARDVLIKAINICTECIGLG